MKPDTHRRTLPIGARVRAGARAATTNTLDVADLAGFVYSAGKVFDGLRVGLFETENLLRSGSLEGITFSSELAFLQDPRDVSQSTITNRESPINSAYARAVNE